MIVFINDVLVLYISYLKSHNIRPWTYFKSCNIYIILHSLILHYIVLYYAIEKHTILYYIILYHITLYYIILHYTILYYIISYYIIPYKLSSSISQAIFFCFSQINFFGPPFHSSFSTSHLRFNLNLISAPRSEYEYEYKYKDESHIFIPYLSISGPWE